MKRIFAILLAVALVIALPLAISAEDVTEVAAETTVDTVLDTNAETTAQEEETSIEATEASTEVYTNEAEEVTAKEENAAETESDELAGLLNAATPEQIDLVKQYISYGLSTLPLPDRVKLMVLDHIDVIAWVLAAIGFVFFGIASLRSGKKHTDEAAVMTDNANEIFKVGIETNELSKVEIVKASESMKNAVVNILESVDAIKNDTIATVKDYCNEVLSTANKTNADASKAIEDLKTKETGNAEAMMLMVQVVDYLVQHSSLPEWERDRLAGIVKSGSKKVEEVIHRDETDEEG